MTHDAIIRRVASLSHADREVYVRLVEILVELRKHYAADDSLLCDINDALVRVDLPAVRAWEETFRHSFVVPCRPGGAPLDA